MNFSNATLSTIVRNYCKKKRIPLKGNMALKVRFSAHTQSGFE
jgi:hypothetical protein